ncbi:MAG: hypothetical protein ACRDOM_09170 [Nocardioides sp.]
MSDHPSDRAPAGIGPEAMRQMVRDYVVTLHTSYVDHVQHLPPAERGALPLIAARQVTVIAAAARRLHLVATTTPMPPPQGQEVELVDDYLGLLWRLRFYDPSVVPELGLLAEDEPEDVRRVLGVADTVYHLCVTVGGGLSGHHAQHSGVALANQHAKTARDLDSIRRALPQQVRAVGELGACVRNGLDLAAALLAAELTARRVVPIPGTPAAGSLQAVLDDVSR